MKKVRNSDNFILQSQSAQWERKLRENREGKARSFSTHCTPTSSGDFLIVARLPSVAKTSQHPTEGGSLVDFARQAPGVAPAAGAR